jgi:hypothetical protein
MMDIHLPEEVNLPASGNLFTKQGFTVTFLEDKVLRITTIVSALDRIKQIGEVIELEL